MSKKNPAAKILKRWRKMDAALRDSDLHVPTFAQRNKVTSRTVHRDLEAFKELGQLIAYDRQEGTNETRWCYVGGTLLFTSNLTAEWREAIREIVRMKRAQPPKEPPPKPQPPSAGLCD